MYTLPNKDFLPSFLPYCYVANDDVTAGSASASQASRAVCRRVPPRRVFTVFIFCFFMGLLVYGANFDFV